MGFITKMVKTIFSPDVPQVSPDTGVTGRDILPSTSSSAPEAAEMGDDTQKKNNRGVSSLLVPTEKVMKGM